jgi:O-antigen/teichoic acid export membrane protein
MSNNLPATCEIERGGSSVSLLGRIRTFSTTLFGITARKFSVSLVDQMVVSGANFITTVLVGRSGGPDELANYALGFSVVLITFSFIEALAATPYTVYAVRLKGTARAAYRGAVLLQCGLLSVLAACALGGWGIAVSSGTGPQGLAPTLYVLSAAIPFYVLREFARQCSFAHLNAKTALYIDLAAATLQITCIAILSDQGRLSAVTAFTTVGAANAVAALTWLIRSRNDVVVQRDQIIPAIRRNVSFGSWILVGRMAAQLNSDIFLIWLMAFVLGSKATGIFAACMTVIHLANPFFIGTAQVLTPRIAHAWVENGLWEVQRVMRKTALFVGLVLSGFCIGVFLFGDEVLRLFYGSQYDGNHLIIIVLSFSVLASVLGLPAGCALFALERPDGNLKANLVGIFLTATVASALILRFELLGVVCGLLCGQIGASAARWRIFARIAAKKPPLQSH